MITEELFSVDSWYGEYVVMVVSIVILTLIILGYYISKINTGREEEGKRKIDVGVYAILMGIVSMIVVILAVYEYVIGVSGLRSHVILFHGIVGLIVSSIYYSKEIKTTKI